MQLSDSTVLSIIQYSVTVFGSIYYTIQCYSIFAVCCSQL